MTSMKFLLLKFLIAGILVGCLFYLIFNFISGMLSSQKVAAAICIILAPVGLSTFLYVFSKEFIDSEVEHLKEGIQNTLNHKFNHLSEKKIDGAFAELSDLQNKLFGAYEKEYNEVEKARRANENKSKFISHVSHEMRTPLTGISGMVQLLADSRIDLSQFNYVEIIQTSTEHLLNIIGDVLSFAKIESGNMELSESAFYLKKTIFQTVEIMKPRADKKKIYLELELDEAVPQVCSGDSTKVRQILFNLIGNALKFTRQGGITIRVEVESNLSVLVLRVEVQDTGMGIKPEKLKEIFKAFKQENSSIEEIYGGTGLGLSISKQLVTLMGGKIDVESVVGKGSTFYFTIKLKPASADEIKRLEEKSLKYKS